MMFLPTKVFYLPWSRSSYRPPEYDDVVYVGAICHIFFASQGCADKAFLAVYVQFRFPITTFVASMSSKSLISVLSNPVFAKFFFRFFEII